jgi:hypothetical protein
LGQQAADLTAGRREEWDPEETGINLVPGLEFVIIDLDPIAIRVLEVDLINFIGPYLNLFSISGPVSVFDIQSVQSFHKSGEIGNGEGEVNIDIMGHHVLGSADHMEFAMVNDFEPNMVVIMEGFGNSFELKYFFVPVCTAVKVGHINGKVVKMGFGLGGGLLCREADCQDKDQTGKRKDFIHLGIFRAVKVRIIGNMGFEFTHKEQIHYFCGPFCKGGSQATGPVVQCLPAGRDSCRSNYNPALVKYI